jgi:hypothetical protein
LDFASDVLTHPIGHASYAVPVRRTGVCSPAYFSAWITPQELLADCTGDLKGTFNGKALPIPGSHRLLEGELRNKYGSSFKKIGISGMSEDIFFL